MVFNKIDDVRHNLIIIMTEYTEYTEYIYLVQPREFIKTKENIYKNRKNKTRKS